jgi:ESS family glutamate:Na+ symporter
MVVPAWVPVLLAVPVLLLGERLVKGVGVLSRFNIPAPVVGGLVVSAGVLAANLAGMATRMDLDTTARGWTWLVTIEPEWREAPARNVNLPFLVGFFTCIGLNASWGLVRRGSVPLAVFLLLAGGLAVIQNVVGLALSALLGVSPQLGLVCGSVSMTGGHATSLGFAPALEEAGLETAVMAGMAAATFGLVAGGLVGGPVGGALIRRRALRPNATPETPTAVATTREAGFLPDLRAFLGYGRGALPHLLLLLVCIKLGAWVSHLLQEAGLVFPVTMGGMLVAVTVRNGLELAGVHTIQTDVVDTLASLTLGVFLAVAMMSLNLTELVHVAAPMLVILSVQVAVVVLFAAFVTFRLMGRDFEAAVMAAGHCGFGLGATPTAVANMKALVESFGPAPRAFLIVPIVGAFLIDFLNAAAIMVFLNLVR